MGCSESFANSQLNNRDGYKRTDVGCELSISPNGRGEMIVLR